MEWVEVWGGEFFLAFKVHELLDLIGCAFALVFSQWYGSMDP